MDISVEALYIHLHVIFMTAQYSLSSRYLCPGSIFIEGLEKYSGLNISFTMMMLISVSRSKDQNFSKTLSEHKVEARGPMVFFYVGGDGKEQLKLCATPGSNQFLAEDNFVWIPRDLNNRWEDTFRRRQLL